MINGVPPRPRHPVGSRVGAGASAQATTGGTGAGKSITSDKAHVVSSYQKGMAVFTVAKGGLMYEATIGGQKFSYKKR